MRRQVDRLGAQVGHAGQVLPLKGEYTGWRVEPGEGAVAQVGAAELQTGAVEGEHRVLVVVLGLDGEVLPVGGLREPGGAGAEAERRLLAGPR